MFGAEQVAAGKFQAPQTQTATEGRTALAGVRHGAHTNTQRERLCMAKGELGKPKLQSLPKACGVYCL